MDLESHVKLVYIVKKEEVLFKIEKGAHAELSYDWTLLYNPSIICLIPLSFRKCPLETLRIFATGTQQMSQKRGFFLLSVCSDYDN